VPCIFAAKLLRLPGHSQWTFALRNTVRRPWRLALTMLALTAGGALLLTAGNLYKSLMRVVDLSLAEQGHDIEVSLPRAVPGTRLEEIARRIPGVTVAEAWRRTGVGVIDPASTLVREPRRFGLTAYPQGTQLLTMPIKEGRWPQPGETDAIVVTRFIQHEIPGLHVGSDLELSFHDRRKPLHVVGVVEEVATPMLYTNFPAFESVTALGDASSDLRVKTTSPDTVVPALDEALLDARIYVGQIQTRADRREVLDEHFSVVVSVANMIALATALVGGICLAAFASLTVLERAREIGVIRTLGATPRTVLRLFLAESAVLAALSALLAVAVSVPATQALNAMTSRLMLQVAVPLVFSWPALALLGSGVLVVMLGVWLPVSRMLRISVRETLAYE
jgi:putative ABC transport system permease protein